MSSLYNPAKQDLTERNYVTSEQHKELFASRLKRDEIDLGKVAEKQDSVTPFSTDESLRNIITGINANEDVNVQDLFEIRRDIVQEMDGQSVFSYSYKRSLNGKTLASSRNVKYILGKRTILVEWGKQTGTDPADRGTNEAERM